MKPTISDIAQLIKTSKDENKDSMFYAKVNSLIEKEGVVVGYNVSLDGTATDTIEAKKVAGANTGDVVQVTIHNGQASVTGTVGGDYDALTALDDAAEAKETADEAQETAEEASNTATSAYNKALGVENHFWYDSYGAHVSTAKTITSGVLNTLINAGGMAIRNGTTELAKFTDSLIELGKNSVSAVIKFCGGNGEIGYNNSSSFLYMRLANYPNNYISINSSGVTLHSTTRTAIASKLQVEDSMGVFGDMTAESVSCDELYVNGQPITPGGGSLPSGTIQMWGGAAGSAPSGWLLCDGSAVSRTTYANLFDAIGTRFGSGNGSTTFNLPNLVKRFPMGTDPNDSTYYTGTTGGLESVTLTAAQSGLRSHTHGDTFSIQSNGSHSHSYTDAHAVSGKATSGTAIYGSSTVETKTTDSAGSHSHSLTGSVSNNTASAATAPHENRPPYQCVNFIIKT